MKFVTFINKKQEQRAGLLMDDYVIDLERSSDGVLPSDMKRLIQQQDKYLPVVEHLNQKGMTHMSSLLLKNAVYETGEITLCAPLPEPSSIRDFYAFEQHVKTARRNRGLDMIPDWYEIPVFYFTNHQAVKGPDSEIEKPSMTDCLDYELEVACVIGKKGRNITVDEAEDYIFGYCILNDWSARDLQRQEMKVGLGPAKGKDFATSIGPYIVTKEELVSYKKGEHLNLEMTAKVNGKLLSSGNLSDLYYSFARMIERASQDVTIYPGDIIGSGTVGTGCILELGTDVHRWLESGDTVELEVTGLGVLRNKIK